MTESEDRVPLLDPAHTRPAEVDTAKRSSGGRHRGDELLAQLRRRYEAAQRLPGGDPLSPAERALGRSREHPHPDRPPLTEVQLDGWRAAILHLHGHGLTAIVPLSVWRALRRRAA
jgi:hypothetical protein